MLHLNFPPIIKKPRSLSSKFQPLAIWPLADYSKSGRWPGWGFPSIKNTTSNRPLVLQTIGLFVVVFLQLISHIDNINQQTLTKLPFPQTSTCQMEWHLLTFLSRHLLAPSQKWKYKGKVWNLFKVNNKDTRIKSLTSLTHIALLFP